MAYATRSKTSSLEHQDEKLDVSQDLSLPMSSQRRPARRMTSSEKKDVHEANGSDAKGPSRVSKSSERTKNGKLEKIDCWQPLR